MGNKKYHIAAHYDAGRQNVGSCMQNYQLKLGMLQSTCVKYGMMCTCELGAFQLKILAAQ